jgi:hypothetical protein
MWDDEGGYEAQQDNPPQNFENVTGILGALEQDVSTSPNKMLHLYMHSKFVVWCNLAALRNLIELHERRASNEICDALCNLGVLQIVSHLHAPPACVPHDPNCRVCLCACAHACVQCWNTYVCENE